MPAAKKPGTKVAHAKLNLPANINAELAAEAAAIASRVGAPGGDKITVTQSKTFKTPDGQEGPGPLSMIIVDFACGNYLYTEAFNRGNITPPKCFALGLEPSGMVPSDKSIEVQAGSCSSCWANQFKSAPNGNGGKACQNTRLLALMKPRLADESFTADDPLVILKVSPTAIRAYDAYVTSVAQAFGKPVRGVVTEIGFNPALEYGSLIFSAVRPCDEEELLAAHARKGEALARLLTEPEFTVAAPAAAGAKRVAPPPAARKPAVTKRPVAAR